MAALHNKRFAFGQKTGTMLSVDALGGFLPDPPHQLFPSGGSNTLHTSWAALSAGPFFCPEMSELPSPFNEFAAWLMPEQLSGEGL
jgi:hypothetical protein